MPAWSPDGKAITFARGNRIWEVGSDGSNPHQLLPGWHAEEGQCCGRWTPDGKFFVFASGQLWGSKGQIWALDERRGLLRQPRTEPIQLTLGPTQWGKPIPSKDGKTIFAEGTSRHGELSRYDAGSKQFRPFLKGVSGEGVSFSKDGRSVAYVSYPEGILWKADRDGGNPVQLSQPPMYPMNPRWSPDGKLILFSDVSRDLNESYIVFSEGGSPRRILPKENGNQSEPNWSPDGKKVVFDTSVLGYQVIGGLRVLDIASGAVTPVPGSAGLFSPRWSPDGKMIVALKTSGSRSITSGLTVFDLETQRWTNLVTKDSVACPAFSSDSQFLYYLLLGNDQAVYRVRTKGGEPERVVDLQDWQMTGYDGFWMGLDTEDAPLLLRDSGNSDLYALKLEDK
jgi:Tol biopolymer transport system component